MKAKSQRRKKSAKTRRNRHTLSLERDFLNLDPSPIQHTTLSASVSAIIATLIEHYRYSCSEGHIDVCCMGAGVVLLLGCDIPFLSSTGCSPDSYISRPRRPPLHPVRGFAENRLSSSCAHISRDLSLLSSSYLQSLPNLL